MVDGHQTCAVYEGFAEQHRASSRADKQVDVALGRGGRLGGKRLRIGHSRRAGDRSRHFK